MDLVVTEGTPVYASGDGVVTVARVIVDRPVVAIRHSPLLRTTYTHVTPKVSEGSKVRAGEVIGVAQGEMIEWGAKTGQKSYLNPLLLLLGRARLVPYDS
ncbi:hypothetical protein BM477_01605 [Boudabousia marimammalium]|uniref:M23ase beta-sheet core domain-containing protein n=1 Tax=Boudabousia marimammalium TaxID=156892 RepID=A0A1Q5PRI5_9ACTO|nr:hypothetical protein BM477_01605 [Boudabousia marimammalium]